MNDDILWKIDSEIGKDKKVVELKREIERKDYLLKEQGKELKDLYKEIERLNTDKEQLNSLVNFNQKEIRRLHSIIKEVREYMKSIEHEPDADMYIELGQYKEYKHILEILDKVEKENDIEFDVLKALNTDLDDDVKMG